MLICDSSILASELHLNCFLNSSSFFSFLRNVFLSFPSLPFPFFPSPVSVFPILLFIHLFKTYGLLHHARPYARGQDSSVNKRQGPCPCVAESLANKNTSALGGRQQGGGMYGRGACFLGRRAGGLVARVTSRKDFNKMNSGPKALKLTRNKCKAFHLSLSKYNYRIGKT